MMSKEISLTCMKIMKISDLYSYPSLRDIKLPSKKIFSDFYFDFEINSNSRIKAESNPKRSGYPQIWTLKNSIQVLPLRVPMSYPHQIKISLFLKE